MKKIRIVVEMHGGTIQGVHADAKCADDIDVVFLEDSKYVETDDERQEFEVEAGEFEGEIIYTHHGVLKTAKKSIDPVFKAAEARLKASEEEDKAK
jgi:hypothetical protein